MLRTRRLLAEPLWKQFFTGERSTELDYMRCFKDQSDPVRLRLTLKVSDMQDSAATDFKDMGDSPMLKGLTLLNYLNFHSQRFAKDTVVIEQFWEAAKSRIEAGQIVWSPLNISLMCEFLDKHQTFALEHLKQNTLAEVFQHALSQDMRLPYLAQAVIGATSMPSYYPKLYDALVAKFNTTKGKQYSDFRGLNSEELRVLTRALFLRPQVQQMIMTTATISCQAFTPAVLRTLQDTLITRLNAGKLDVIHVVDIMEAFHNLTDKQDASFDEQMMSWVLKLLDPAEDMRLKNVELKPSQIIELAAHITPNSPQAKVIFRLASNRFFLRFVMAKGPYSMTLRPDEKLPIMINYIRVAAKHKIFQVVYLDQAVNSIVEMIDSSDYPWTFASIADALKGLAELNYAGRFNPSMLSKEHHWQAWQALLSRCEAIILQKMTVSTAAPSADDLGEEEDNFDPGEVAEEETIGGSREAIIDVLWAFAVFEHYSKPLLGETVSQLMSAGTYSEEQYAKLIQIMYWLKLEYMDEFKFDPLLEAELMDYKVKWDRQSPPDLPRSDLKSTIRETLIAQNQPFIENFRDFPYILDFVSEREAILVEDDSTYLDGSESLIRSGRKRLEYRQLTRLDWVLKRLSLKSWLKVGHLDLFSKRN